MKRAFGDKLERGRVRYGSYATLPTETFGAFKITGPLGERLTILVSNGDEQYPWEHVSVSTPTRTPNWREMCFVKDLFWAEDEVVMQLHPAKSEYVNNHPHCLHLWRPLAAAIPLPPSITVGYTDRELAAAGIGS